MLLLALTGCAWQRIPVEPSYPFAQNPLPIRIGAQLSDDPASLTYGPSVIAVLKKWQVFDSITFPYREGDDVDAVLLMSIRGEWRVNKSTYINGFVVGLSLFTLSPFLGPSMTGEHTADALLRNEAGATANYRAYEKTPITWGLGADAGDVGRKADSLQISRLAYDLAEQIRLDWPRTGTQFIKSDSTTTGQVPRSKKTAPNGQADSQDREASTATDEIAQKLMTLKQLLNDGLLTQKEYEKKRQALIQQL